MSRSRTEHIQIKYVILGIVVCLIIVAIVRPRYQQAISCYEVRAPLKSFFATLDLNRQQQLVEQIQDFADKNGFDFNVVYYPPNGDKILINLKRTDVEITIVNPFEAQEYRVRFYNNDCLHPTTSGEVASLVNQLESLMRAIPGVEIIKEE